MDIIFENDDPIPGAEFSIEMDCVPRVGDTVEIHRQLISIPYCEMAAEYNSNDVSITLIVKEIVHEIGFHKTHRITCYFAFAGQKTEIMA